MHRVTSAVEVKTRLRPFVNALQDHKEMMSSLLVLRLAGIVRHFQEDCKYLSVTRKECCLCKGGLKVEVTLIRA